MANVTAELKPKVSTNGRELEVRRRSRAEISSAQARSGENNYRAGSGDRSAHDRAAGARALSARWRPWSCKNAADPDAGGCTASLLQPHSIYPRSDAHGYYGNGNSRTKSLDRAARNFDLFAGRSLPILFLADEINRTPPKRRPRCSKPCRSIA